MWATIHKIYRAAKDWLELNMKRPYLKNCKQINKESESEACHKINVSHFSFLRQLFYRAEIKVNLIYKSPFFRHSF